MPAQRQSLRLPCRRDQPRHLRERRRQAVKGFYLFMAETALMGAAITACGLLGAHWLRKYGGAR